MKTSLALSRNKLRGEVFNQPNPIRPNIRRLGWVGLGRVYIHRFALNINRTGAPVSVKLRGFEPEALQRQASFLGRLFRGRRPIINHRHSRYGLYSHGDGSTSF